MIASQNHISLERAQDAAMFVRRPRGRYRKKFSVIREPMSLCETHSHSAWSTESMDSETLSTDNYHDSVEEYLRRAAEKVNNKIVMNRRIYGGAPCIANTRVPVYAILELVEAGYSHKKILKSFPMIDREGLEAALQFAVFVMER